MGEILFQYNRVSPTTWSYLSSLLTLALFFKFSRFWAIRNLDLVLLMLLAPGLLCVKYGVDNPSVDGGATIEVIGYIWLFSVNALLVTRMLLDSSMVRRPLLEPNLTADALTFLAVSLLVFLTANVITGIPQHVTALEPPSSASASADSSADPPTDSLQAKAPPKASDFAPLWRLPLITTQAITTQAITSQALSSQVLNSQPERSTDTTENTDRSNGYVVAARVLVIVAQLMIVLGMLMVGWRHFESIRMGVAAATLYLLLPYTAMWTGALPHALPGALIVWAIVFYRRPVVAGALLGFVVVGTIHFPIYLLPLWTSFYWRRGLKRFITGVTLSTTAIIVALVFVSPDSSVFGARVLAMLGVQAPLLEGLTGVWGYWYGYYRYPLIAIFAFLSVSLVLWPAQKNLATLISCSAALMLGTQYWHAHSGGVSLAWCLPMLLLTIFRPNLEDRIAVEVVWSGRSGRSKPATN